MNLGAEIEAIIQRAKREMAQQAREAAARQHTLLLTMRQAAQNAPGYLHVRH